MVQRLHARLSSGAEGEEARGVPATKLRGSGVKWKKVSDYCIQSDDGQFTVCKIGEKFEAWQLKDQFAVNLDTADEARAACEGVRQTPQVSRES